MATEQQIEANRANAAHSTGPVTEEGKARAACNSLTHGLTSKDLFVAPLDREEFDAIHEALRDDLSPNTPREFTLFNQIVSTYWRLLRCDRSEAGLLDRLIDSVTDPMLDPNLQSTLNTILRVRAQATRDFHKATAELRKVQTEIQYRIFCIPECEGIPINALGLADWQSLRMRMKKEQGAQSATSSRDLHNTLTSMEIMDRQVERELDLQNEPNCDSRLKEEVDEDDEPVMDEATRQADKEAFFARHPEFSRTNTR